MLTMLPHVRFQMICRDELFVTFGARKPKLRAMNLHMLKEMTLLLERFIGTLRTEENFMFTMSVDQMIVQLGNAGVFFMALITNILLDFMMRLKD